MLLRKLCLISTGLVVLTGCVPLRGSTDLKAQAQSTPNLTSPSPTPSPSLSPTPSPTSNPSPTPSPIPSPTTSAFKNCNGINVASVQHEQGNAYIIPSFLQNTNAVADTSSAPTQSNIVLWEGSTQLGPAHSVHDDIRNLGGGRFSFWIDTLYFSSTDNTNPAANGRAYSYGVPKGAICPTLYPIVAWGDSHTNDDRVPVDYPNLLALATSYKVINKGVSGQTSTQIYNRFLSAPQFWGITPTLIWVGHNDYNNTTDFAAVEAQIKANIAGMVSKVYGQYLVLGLMSRYPKGSGYYNSLTRLNRDLATIYGSHYVDVQSALLAANNPNDPQDVADVANGLVPTSLTLNADYGDPYHLNSSGDNVVALAVQAALYAQ